MINPLSNRSNSAGYVRPKPTAAPAGGESFADLAARAAADRKAKASADEAAYQPGIQPWLAAQLASERPVAKVQATASVQKDWLWALTGPGRAAKPEDDAAPRLDLRA